ncbi:MAG: phosphocholine cytidylyltransferase family protein [Thermodesulfobacteriota bacterium]|nr:phosphocholine cytidylyltransferase family protein [Thermodesulfobacteriota bacterium]
MRAIILAAGRSTRLYPLTLDKPKCLLTIGNNTIIEHQITWLRGCGVDDILVVIGYLGHRIKKVLGNTIRYKYYKDFGTTNNLHTLYHVRDELKGDIVILFSDVLLSKDLLKRCIENTKDFRLIIDKKNVTCKTMRVKIKDNSIYDIGNHIPVQEGDGNFTGIAGFSKKGVELLVGQMEKMVKDEFHKKSYYTAALTAIAGRGHTINYIDVKNEPWIEIDYEEDYQKAQRVYKP